MYQQKQKQVPFLFWTTNENLKKKLLEKKDKKTSHDNIFHTILGVFNISSIVKKDSLDLTL